VRHGVGQVFLCLRASWFSVIARGAICPAAEWGQVKGRSAKRPTSNIQRRTSNAQHPMSGMTEMSLCSVQERLERSWPYCVGLHFVCVQRVCLAYRDLLVGYVLCTWASHGPTRTMDGTPTSGGPLQFNTKSIRFSHEDRQGHQEDQIHVCLWPDWRFAVVAGQGAQPARAGRPSRAGAGKTGRFTCLLEPANALYRKHVPDALLVARNASELLLSCA